MSVSKDEALEVVRDFLDIADESQREALTECVTILTTHAETLKKEARAALVSPGQHLKETIEAALGIGVLRVGDLTLNPLGKRCWQGDERIALGPNEFTLLWSIVRLRGKLAPNERLCRELWGQYGDDELRRLRVVVGVVRTKLWGHHWKAADGPMIRTGDQGYYFG